MSHLLAPKFVAPARVELTDGTTPASRRAGVESTGLSLGDLARILRSHALFILFCAAASVAACFAYLHWHRPYYEASATLRIDPSRSRTLEGDDRPGAELLSQGEAIDTEAGVMKSNRVAVRALDSLTDDQFLRTTGYSRESFFPVEGDVFSADQARVLDAVGTQTIVIPQDGTQLVTVGFRNQDPWLAALMVNRLIAGYESEGLERRTASVTQLRSMLTAEMAAVKTQLDTSEGQLADFQQAHSILGTGPEATSGGETSSNTIIDRLRFLNERLATAQADRIVKEGQFEAAERGSTETLAVMFSDPKLNELQTQQGALSARYAQLAAKFDVQYPPLVDIKKQIDIVNAEVLVSANVIRKRLKQDYDAASFVEKGLRDQYNNQIAAAYSLNRSEAEYSVLQQQVASGRELYDSLQKRQQQALMDAEVDGVNVIVVDNANVPAIPHGPQKSFFLLSSATLGLLAGSFVVLALELTSDKVQRPQQVEQAVGYRVLGCLPRAEQLRSPAKRSELRFVPLRRPPPAGADAYRAVRNRLLLSNSGQSQKILVVLSASPEEGAEVVAINTAIALAQANLRVLLVDGNLRNPSLHSGFNVPNSLGLGDVLAEPDLRPFCTPMGNLPNLLLVTAGKQDEILSDGLASSALHAVLKKWESEFDYIIVSSTPLLQLSDSLLLAREADAIVLVARYDRTRLADLTQVREMLEDTGAKVAGVLINDVPSKTEHLTYASKS